MFNQWRRFQFFDKELVKGEDGRSPHPDLQKLQITAAASGKGQTIFGDEEGCITLCDRKFQLCKFQAFERKVTHLFQLQQQNVLVSVGDDHLSGPVLKVWNLDKTDRDTDGFLNVLSKDVFEGLSLSRCPATCVTASEGLSLIAVGLQSGHVVLVQGDVQHNKASSRVLNCSPSFPIVAMGMHTINSESWFLVATASRVLSFQNLRQDSMEVLDEQGCSGGTGLPPFMLAVLTLMVAMLPFMVAMLPIPRVPCCHRSWQRAPALLALLAILSASIYGCNADIFGGTATFTDEHELIVGRQVGSQYTMRVLSSVRDGMVRDGMQEDKNLSRLVPVTRLPSVISECAATRRRCTASTATDEARHTRLKVSDTQTQIRRHEDTQIQRHRDTQI
eukprot:3458786-Rhodomonas_salina.2